MIKSALHLSAAMALAILATSPLAAAKLRLPPPRAPEQNIYSPFAIAGELQKRGYQIESIKRQGTAYSIKAIGPHKNKVQLMVDGRSGEIVGLAVLEAAANLVSAIAQAMNSGKSARYVDDLHPFGIIVPEVYQTDWISITTWTAAPGSPRYVQAGASGRGYRYAVPYKTIRPGRGGRSRSTISPSRMQRPVYDVYEANGTELETVSTEDTTIISEVTTEETTYSEEYSAMDETYLGGELADVNVDEVSDFDAEDGDFDFADDANDGYDADVDESDFAAFSDETDETAVADDSADDEDVSADEPDDDDMSADEPDDDDMSADEPDDDSGDYDDDGDDFDDGGDDYEDGGDEPDLAAVR